MECLLALLNREIGSWIAFAEKINRVQLEAGQDKVVGSIDSSNCISTKTTFIELSKTC